MAHADGDAHAGERRGQHEGHHHGAPLPTTRDASMVRRIMRVRAGRSTSEKLENTGRPYRPDRAAVTGTP